MSRQLASYEARNGNEITLTDDVIRRYLCDNPDVTDKEIMLFAALCKGNGLDPFNREAYLVKYRDKPATMIVSKDVFVKRAAAHPKFRGFEAGITVLSADRSRLVERAGSLVLDGEQIVGGWCKVHIEGYECPMYDSVSFNEYSTGRSNWSTKPATMIRKVALVHALREAFPEQLSGMYESTEMGVEDIPSDRVGNENVISNADFVEVEPDPIPEYFGEYEEEF